MTQTILETFSGHAQNDPEKEAIHFFDADLNRKDLMGLARGLAGHMQ